MPNFHIITKNEKFPSIHITNFFRGQKIVQEKYLLFAVKIKNHIFSEKKPVLYIAGLKITAKYALNLVNRRKLFIARK